MDCNFLACDCGNSSVRVILCRYDGARLSTETVMQEPNDMIRIGEYDYWDMLRIFDLLKQGIRKAAKTARIHSIGFCTWGVDFAFFAPGGYMLAAPLSYRNSMGAAQMERLDAGELREMFFRTGILSDKINSVFMLMGMREKMPHLVNAGGKLLMIPDILNYFFTGVMVNEPSELSTTQLLDTRTMAVSGDQCARCGIDPEWFSPIGKHGGLIGMVTPEIRDELGLDYEVPVVCVPSHDTASAVLGTPAREENFAFVSAGTWALIGLCRNAPVINERVYAAGFTNEVGPFGRITLLKNSVGLFIMQRLRKEYGAVLGREPAWRELDELARTYRGRPLLFDVNHPEFFHPRRMSRAIWAYLERTNQTAGEMDWSALLAAAKSAMAASYAYGFARAFEATDTSCQRVYVVGGGAKDREINQCFADITGMEVVACAMECASVGNALAQLAYAFPALSYGALRGIAADSLETEIYRRQEDRSQLLRDYEALVFENKAEK